MRSAQMYEEDELITGPTSDADFHLGMGSLIGIFFGLALVCGGFFGFGYMMGHRTPGAYVASEPLYTSPTPTTVASAPKPSAQVLTQPSDTARVVVPNTATDEASSAPTASPDSASAEPEVVPAATPAPKVQAAVQTATANVPVPTLVSFKPAGVATGTIMVQIAAVRNRPDAEALASALRKNGFSPTIRAESGDKLLHVQVGPFAVRDDAKNMRQKLSSAGYNAFIK